MQIYLFKNFIFHKKTRLSYIDTTGLHYYRTLILFQLTLYYHASIFTQCQKRKVASVHMISEIKNFRESCTGKFIFIPCSISFCVLIKYSIPFLLQHVLYTLSTIIFAIVGIRYILPFPTSFIAKILL